MKIIKYGTTWCSNCRILEETLKGHNIPFEVCDLDEHPEEGERLNIDVMPVLIAYDDEGKEISRYDETKGSVKRWYDELR